MPPTGSPCSPSPRCASSCPGPSATAASRPGTCATAPGTLRLWQRDDFLALAVEHEGRLIGDVSLHLRTVAAEARSIEIGWVLHPSAGGQGFATEAARAVLDHAFEVLGAREVTAVTDARNRRSVALARRLGFDELAPGHLVLRAHPTRASAPRMGHTGSTAPVHPEVAARS